MGTCMSSLIVHNVVFLSTTNLKFHAKELQILGKYPLSKGSVMLCSKERHPLLLDYFIPFLKYIRMVGRANNGLYESLMVHNMSFLPTTNIKFHGKFDILSTLSGQDMC